MEHNVERAEAAFERISDDQIALIGRCLRAIVEGPYIDDDYEFQTVIGVTRDEAATVAASWPDPTGAPYTFVVVSNTLNNLLGYPHKRWPELSEYLGADSRPLVAALAQGRGQDLSDDPGMRYFESLE